MNKPSTTRSEARKQAAEVWFQALQPRHTEDMAYNLADSELKSAKTELYEAERAVERAKEAEEKAEEERNYAMLSCDEKADDTALMAQEMFVKI